MAGKAARITVLTAALATLALPALAQSAADKAAVIQAIANAGCRVNSGNNTQVLAAAGIGEDRAAAVVQALLNSGEAVTMGGDLVLKTGPCR